MWCWGNSCSGWGKEVFCGCTSLKTLRIPASVEEVGSHCFQRGMEEIVVEGTPVMEEEEDLLPVSYRGPVRPEPVRIQGQRVVHWVPGTEIRDPDAVEELIFPDSLPSLPYEVCSGLRHLRRVHLPKNLRTIPPRAFCGCGELQEIVLPDGVLYIGPNAFCDTGLREIAIPGSVLGIGDAAFRSLALESIRFSEGLLEIGMYAFAGCTHLQELSFPGSVRHIRSNAFTDCSALKEIAFQEGLRSIGWDAFWGASFSQVVLPASVRKVEFFTPSCGQLILAGSCTRLDEMLSIFPRIFAPAMPLERFDQREEKLVRKALLGFVHGMH